MSGIYSLGIALYSLLIRLVSPFNSKARLFVQGRKNWKSKITQQVDSNGKYIWIHSASLGEFEQGRPVIEKIKELYPEYKIALTFFSPSGYEIRKNYAEADLISYLPMDTQKNAQTFLSIIQPEKAFFIKYEFWYHYLSELNRREIPCYIFSSIFRPEQYFFKNNVLGTWYRKSLQCFEHIFVQNKESVELLKGIGIHNISIAGDTRFDRVASIARSAPKLPLIEKFKAGKLLVIAGSTWKPDEEILASYINNSTDIKFIVAPHEVSTGNINNLHKLLKKPAISHSEGTDANVTDKDVLIIDSIGILSSLYQYGNLAYIGGGFGVGIHNILEAATFGMPIVFGPNYTRFKEATDLCDLGGAFSITNEIQLKDHFDSLLSQPKHLNQVSAITKKYVAGNVGSSDLIIKKVFNTPSS